MSPEEALQAALAAEHAAVATYAVLGGRLPATDNPLTAAGFLAAYDVHRDRRDRFRSLVAAAGEVPAPAAPAYRIPARTRDPLRLVGVARETEERCAEVYAQLVAASTGDVRRLAVEALADAAVRSLQWGAAPATWPGAPEL